MFGRGQSGGNDWKEWKLEVKVTLSSLVNRGGHGENENKNIWPQFHQN